jgi:formylglycine-generating enzyme required for sulfatase activity
VADWYDPNYYTKSPSQEPLGLNTGKFRVFRGGSFHYGGNYARSTYRGKIDPNHSDYNLGFRCAQNASP